MTPAAPPGPAGRTQGGGSGPTPTSVAAESGHVWAIDVIRLLTFTAVITTHALAFTESPSSVGAAGVLMLSQFGRWVFFALSGFVLVYSTRGRPLRVGSFWRKRFLFVAAPFAAWTVIYAVVSYTTPPYPTWTWSHALTNALDGTTYYHLYFLLVTMQLYLVFPLLLRGVRATAHRPWPVLGVVGGLNVAWLAVLAYVPAPAGWVGTVFWLHSYELLPSYALLVLVGCYAALHYPRLRLVVLAHRPALLAAAVVSTAGALTVYALQLGDDTPRVAAAALQPATLLSVTAALCLLSVIGFGWAEGHRRGQAAVVVASDVSFGVYLAHPLLLTVLLNIGLTSTDHDIWAPLATVLAVVGCATGATLLALVLRRTPLALPLIGRRRLVPETPAGTRSQEHLRSSR